MHKKESAIPRGHLAALQPQRTEHRPSSHLRPLPDEDYVTSHALTVPHSPNHPSHEKKLLPEGLMFVTHAPGAKQVILTGEFTDWATDRIPLTSIDGGAWSTVLHLDPGEYQYRLLIDGQWSDDPDATTHVPNPYFGQNSVLKVP